LPILSQTIFYPAISLKSLSIWNCTTVDTARFLTADLSVPCTGDAYTTATVFNILFVVGVVVGWPAFLVWYLRRIYVRGRTTEQTVLDRVGFVYAPYRPDYLYWDVLETVRKLYLVLRRLHSEWFGTRVCLFSRVPCRAHRYRSSPSSRRAA